MNSLRPHRETSFKIDGKHFPFFLKLLNKSPRNCSNLRFLVNTPKLLKLAEKLNVASCDINVLALISICISRSSTFSLSARPF